MTLPGGLERVHVPAEPAPDILGSRLGRKLVYRFLFVAMFPLTIFCLPLYFQTTSLLDSQARSTLIGYSQLAKGSLFSALERARSHLEQLDLSGENLPAASEKGPFRRFLRLDEDLRPAPGERVPWQEIDQGRRGFLSEGKVILTRPYPIEEGMTLALIVPARRGFVAAEMDPGTLWDVTRAGLYGPHGSLMVISDDGRLLASSMSGLRPLQSILPRLPGTAQSSGEGELPGAGACIWGFNEFWLEGAFGGERWGLLTVQTRQGVFELPILLMKSLLVLLGIAFCAIVILSFRYGREILAPVVMLARATREVSWEGKSRIRAVSDDELGDLARSFNEMTDRLRETHEESVRLTREAMVGRLAAMVAHQVNTPLAAMKVKLELLEEKAPAHAEALRVVAGQVTRIETTVKALLGFAKLRNRPGARTRVNETIRNVEALFRDTFESRGFGFEVDLPAEETTVAASADDLQELLVNLLENALDACVQAGEKEDGTSRGAGISVENGPDAVVLRIEDDGVGLPAETRKLFDAFYTSKIHGTGLGLAICRRICETVGGEIRAEHRAGGGSRFVVSLPRESSPA